MRKTSIIAIVLYLTFSIVSTIGAAKASKPLNIIIIIDTSDRVSDERHPGQIERDKELIKEIVNEFEKVTKQHINESEGLQYDDRLAVVIPNQPGVPPVPRQIIRNLTIRDENRNDHSTLAGIKRDVEDRKQKLLEALDTLYEFVRQHRHTGSDIWEWFRYEAESYFLENRRNIVVCISDGYLNFDNIIEANRIHRTYMQIARVRNNPNWKQEIQGDKGLLPIGKDFSRYKVDFLMSEIQLQTDENSIPYQKDFEIITFYWEAWLKTMGIESTDFGKVGQDVGQKIKNLIEMNR